MSVELLALTTVGVEIRQYNQNPEDGFFLLSGCRVCLAFVCTSLYDARVHLTCPMFCGCPLQVCGRTVR